MRTNSFRTRLLIAFWSLLTIALVLPPAYSSYQLRQSIAQSEGQEATKHLELAYWLLKEHAPAADMAELDHWATQLDQKLGLRITYIVGRDVLIDSRVPYPEVKNLDDHSTRPEVLRAIDNGQGMSTRFSKTLGKELIYVARTVSDIKGLPAGVLRLAVPVAEVRDKADSIFATTLWFLPVALVLTAGLAFIFSRVLFSSIQRFTAAASDIGAGNYSRRLRIFPGSEFQPLAESINHMAASIEKHISNLEDQKGQWETLFNGMGEGVLVLNETGHIESYNPSITKIFKEETEYIGKTPLEATMNVGLQQAIDILLESPKGTSRVATDLHTSDSRHLEVSLEPFRDQHGMRKIVLVFRDVTQLRRLERVRKDFVANVSHELKTPITNIKGYAETLYDQPVPEEQQKNFLKVILTNADHLTKVVKDLLLLSKLEYSGPQKELDTASAQEALDHALSLVAPTAEEKGVEFVVDIPDGRIPVKGGQDDLGIIFRNIIANAIQHSPEEGRITITAEPAPDASGAPGMLKFCIQDQGLGVPEPLRERIFERFYRVGAQQGLKDGGSGLGLAICRHMIESFGGNIWVTAPSDEHHDLNPGALFCFTLRCAK